MPPQDSLNVDQSRETFAYKDALLVRLFGQDLFGKDQMGTFVGGLRISVEQNAGAGNHAMT